MNEKYYAWLIFIAVVLFAIIGLIFAKSNFLTGADVAEVSIDTSGNSEVPVAEQSVVGETDNATVAEQTTQPSAEDELKKKQEFIEESFKNATAQAIQDVAFVSCVEVKLHGALPQGSIKGVVQKFIIQINGKKETKIQGFPDRCSENGRKAIINYCSNKHVFQKEQVCDKKCIAGICV